MDVTASFSYPFRRGAARAWWPGLLLVALFPISFVLLFGYAVRAIRVAAAEPTAPPPGVVPDRRMLVEGLAVSAAAVLVAIPYVVAVAFVSGALRARVPAGVDPFLAGVETTMAAGIAVLVPWGTALLIAAPPGLAALAETGRAQSLFDVPAAIRTVRGRFVAWNLATVVIVTAWAIALAGAGVLCIGFIPAAFYAILVSAHATATLVEAPPSGTPAAPAG